MSHAFTRTELLLGNAAMEKLYTSTVAIFGIGGVGTFVVEGLARSGVGRFLLVDDDVVCTTNINRQIHATVKTVGMDKVAVMRDRIMQINPKAQVRTMKRFYMAPARGKNKPDSTSADAVNNPLYWSEILEIHDTSEWRIDYIVDAIDTVSAKLDLVENAIQGGIPVISSMGAGNKLDPTQFRVADIFETEQCPLARVMRQELRKRGVKKLKVVYSQEPPLTPLIIEEEQSPTSFKKIRRSTPGSISFVPSVVGLIIAGEVTKDLIRPFLTNSELV